jgi:hypothetical protein
MTWEQFVHVLRASASITQETSFVVIGSQAVLASHPNAPQDLLLSNELDLYPALHPERADLIDGAIGQLSMFHDTFGYYADGVGPETAKMPTDWMQYSRLHYIGDLTVIVPDLHDLAVSKCVAGRDKDAHWIAALLRHKMIELPRFIERLKAMDATQHNIEPLVAWAERRAQEAAA